MIFEEPHMRRQVDRGFSLDNSDNRLLFGELDRLRSYLERIEHQAVEHIADKQPGWSRWSATLSLVREALGK